MGLKFFAILFLTAALIAPQVLPGQDAAGFSASTAETRAVVPATAPYVQPTETMKLHNYFFDAFGPYPLTIAAFVAGYHQARRNPPDWREGFAGYGERYGSDLGISAINATAGYSLAEVLHQDTLYYSCGCKGVGRRLIHAVVSTLVAREGEDGHNVFALPSVVAPYVGPLVAVPLWYPARYSAKDAFRMGNYGLLDFAVGNIGVEFLPGLFHPRDSSRLKRWHFDNRRAAHEGESAP